METKHTSEPWDIWDDGKKTKISITHAGREVASVPRRHEQSQANARLISAAPELLKALTAVKFWFEERQLKTLHDRIISAAISKAMDID